MEMQDRNPQTGQLIRLSQMEYETEPGKPDLLGWPVVDADDNEAGILDDMLVDVDTGDIPFCSICYNSRCTIVPIDMVYMDEQNQRLVLPITRDELMEAPEFTDETTNLQSSIDFWDSLSFDWEEIEGDEPDSGSSPEGH